MGRILAVLTAIVGGAIAITSYAQIGTVPFTAREGLTAAQREANALTQQPSIIIGMGISDNGTAPVWGYIFTTLPEDTYIMVTQPAINFFYALRVEMEDTTALEEYYRGLQLPDGWINSDRAMSFIRGNSTYAEWMSLYGSQLNPNARIIFAGYIREGIGHLPSGSPAWIYLSFDSTHSSELVCWCQVEPSPSPIVGCVSSSLSSVLDRNHEEVITLTPNPASDMIQIRAFSTIEEVRVFSLPGSLVSTPHIASGPFVLLDVHHLPPGCYVLELSSGGKRTRQLFHILR